MFAPGVLGVICLLIGGYGLNLLPIDYAGAALALFGIGLMVAEAWVPAFGAFVIGGAAAFLIGSLMMFENPAFRPSLSAHPRRQRSKVCIDVRGGAGGALRARRAPGDERQRDPDRRLRPCHRLATAPKAGCKVGGEYWNARAEGALEVGERAARDRPRGFAPDRRSGLNRAASACPQEDRMEVFGLQNLTAVLVVVVLVLILGSVVRIMREYQRAVMFTLGRFTGVKGPGLIFVIPIAQQIIRVDLRTVVLDVPSQDVISRDNVSVKVNAVLYFRVVDADRAVIQVEDFLLATSQLAQTTLRSVLGKHTLDEMLADRDRLNSDIQEILNSQTEIWGIKVSSVEIKQVDLNESMVRAIGRQAEAERLRRAKIINAEGEQQAAEKLTEAARVLSATPGAMQLRYLGTLSEIAGEKNSTIVFPFPIDMPKVLRAITE